MNTEDRNEIKQTLRLDWAIIIFLLAQTGAGIWWASSMTTSQEFLKQQVEYLLSKTEDRYRAEDARRDWALQEQKNLQIDKRILAHEKKIERLEEQVFKLPQVSSRP